MDEQLNKSEKEQVAAEAISPKDTAQGPEKSHAGEAFSTTQKTKNKSQVRSEAKIKEKKAHEETEEAKEEAGLPSEPGEETEPMVTIKSADKRPLEASIGDVTWKGVEIHVPQSQAGDVRRMLEDAGYFLKD